MLEFTTPRMDNVACDVVSNKASADASFSGECLWKAIADSCPESHIVAPVIQGTTASYTHVRAQETDRKLVCRPRMENKKEES